MRLLPLVVLLLLSACSSERHFAAHTLWPFGNPNAPANASENAQRALLTGRIEGAEENARGVWF